MDNRNTNQQYDKKMLKEHLDKFSKEQLKEYFDIIAGYSFHLELFMEADELCDLLKELNRQVRSKDLAFPSIVDDSMDALFVDNQLYFFDYLDKEVIADMLCRYIYHNVIIAENTAQTLYDCGVEAARQYPNMALSIQAHLEPGFKVLM